MKTIINKIRGGKMLSATKCLFVIVCLSLLSSCIVREGHPRHHRHHREVIVVEHR